MNYYDLVDTLISVPGATGLGGYLKGLPNATVKYHPRGAFKIITSQPALANRRVRDLIAAKFPNCLDVIIVTSTKGKINALQSRSATNYTDNDPKVRAAIAKALPNIDLFKISNGVRKPA
jgi:hypothetical protein